MRISDLLLSGISFSFEFFPPKTEKGSVLLHQSIGELRDLEPSFVSVTYGAGGTTHDRTIGLVGEIKRDFGMETMAHLTCVGASRKEISQVLTGLQDEGISNVLALRGDPPVGQEFVPAEGGFHYANELADFIRSDYMFCVGGACYPEGHTECVSLGRRDLKLDMGNLKRKVDAGCEFLITQMFFDNQFYFDFVNRARAVDITVPIIPGIMPITNVQQIRRFTQMCGTTIPEHLLSKLEGADSDAVLSQGVAHATAQCIDLLQHGAPGVHFYTLNKSKATRSILTALRMIWPPVRIQGR